MPLYWHGMAWHGKSMTAAHWRVGAVDYDSTCVLYVLVPLRSSRVGPWRRGRWWWLRASARPPFWGLQRGLDAGRRFAPRVSGAEACLLIATVRLRARTWYLHTYLARYLALGQENAEDDTTTRTSRAAVACRRLASSVSAPPKRRAAPMFGS